MKTIQTISITFFLLLISSVVTAAPLKIFVSIAPQEWIALQIGNSLVEPHILVAAGQNPHSYEPTPKQLVELSRAKLFFSVGMPFEERLLDKISQTAVALKFVDTSRQVRKIPMEGQNHGKAHHGNEQFGLDPHIWLSPPNLKIMASTMAEALILADPDNAAEYAANLKKTVLLLERLNEKIHKQLALFYGKTFYVFHPAFGYFAREYNLHQKAVEVAGKSPSPKQLSRLIASAKKNTIKTIFVQPQFDSRSAAAIAGAIGGQVLPLNPLAEDVIGNLELMADTIETALK